MLFLGINSFFEHPSVALIEGGNILYAVEDERFTGIKNGKRYSPYSCYVPVDSIHAALKYTGATVKDITEVAYSYSPRKHLASLFGCFTGKRFSPFIDEIYAYSMARAFPRALRSGEYIGQRYHKILKADDFRDIPYKYWEHHLAHAASTFYCSGWNEALILVADGAGERACTTAYIGQGKNIKEIYRQELPNSLGHFYSYVTKYLGFEPFSDEFKVMGMAAYGENKYLNIFREVIRTLPQGNYRLNLNLLQNIESKIGVSREFGASLEQHHFDVAKSAQSRLEEVVLHILKHLRIVSRQSRLCLAGGTFLNCVCNGYIVGQRMFDDIFVQPASSDAGTAIGAAALSSVVNGNEPQLSFNSFAVGNEYSDAIINQALISAGINSPILSDSERVNLLAGKLAEGKVCAVFRDRMEFGPRALGKRSLLANPIFNDTRYKLNEIKSREQFRPVAPIVTAEYFDDYFEGQLNSYMLFTCNVRVDKREMIPSAVHVDGSARVQVIKRENDKFLHELLELFKLRTGHPVLINTSFNIAGKPIVEKPVEAIAAFLSSRIDCLMIGSFFLEKGELNVK